MAERARSRSALLPNFVIIGAQKAGTTSLWRYLRSHPAVFMSPTKEPDFFVAEQQWGRGRAWYESLFAPAGSGAYEAIGEASPSYTMFPQFAGVPARMASVLPEARLIYVLRDPVERMISSYLHALTHGSESLPIDRALLERSHYLDHSRYATQIEQYLPHYDRRRLLLLLHEKLEREPGATLERVLGFLGLEPSWRPSDLGARYNVSGEKRVPRRWWRRCGGLMIRAGLPARRVPMPLARSPITTRNLRSRDRELSAAVREQLEAQLRPEIERLCDHLEPDFDGWGLLA